MPSRTFHRAALVAALVSGLALTACSVTDSPTAPPTTSGASPAASLAAAARPMDAKAVIEALAAAGLPLSNIAVQDENTDPNDKLGRPNQYTSRSSADVPGGDKDSKPHVIDRGLVVEVFATADDADMRSKFILDTLKSMPALGAEYHYRPADRRILVRLTGNVKPSAAKPFDNAVAALK